MMREVLCIDCLEEKIKRNRKINSIFFSLLSLVAYFFTCYLTPEFASWIRTWTHMTIGTIFGMAFG